MKIPQKINNFKILIEVSGTYHGREVYDIELQFPVDKFRELPTKFKINGIKYGFSYAHLDFKKGTATAFYSNFPVNLLLDN